MPTNIKAVVSSGTNLRAKTVAIAPRQSLLDLTDVNPSGLADGAVAGHGFRPAKIGPFVEIDGGQGRLNNVADDLCDHAADKEDNPCAEHLWHKRNEAVDEALYRGNHTVEVKRLKDSNKAEQPDEKRHDPAKRRADALARSRRPLEQRDTINQLCKRPFGSLCQQPGDNKDNGNDQRLLAKRCC